MEDFISTSLLEEPPSQLTHKLTSQIRHTYYQVARFIRSNLRELYQRPTLRYQISTGIGLVCIVLVGIQIWTNQPQPASAAEMERARFVFSTIFNPDDLSPIDQNIPVQVSTVDTSIGGVATEMPKPIQHAVATGETLSGIAALYNLYSSSIALANPDLKNPDMLTPGQVLIIPAADASEEEIKKELASRANKVKEAIKTTVSNSKASVSKVSSTNLNILRPIGGTGITQYLSSYHPAVDFGAPSGTRVKAALSGCVAYAARGGWNGGYGNMISISHGGGISTLYAHLSVEYVKTGDCVEQGDTIGLSGNSGRSTGPHLHFELRKNGSALNPLKYF